MNPNHWTDERMTRRLYGLEGDDGHIESCDRCRDRWERMCGKKRSLAMTGVIPEEFLAIQRRSILRRLKNPQPRLQLKALPAMAAILLILVVATIFRQDNRQEPPEGLPDPQLYQEVFSMAGSTSSSAVEPIESLFEVEQ